MHYHKWGWKGETKLFQIKSPAALILPVCLSNVLTQVLQRFIAVKQSQVMEKLFIFESKSDQMLTYCYLGS